MARWIRCCAVIAVFVAGSRAAHGTATAGTYTLSECIRSALEKNPDLLGASAELAKARARLGEARAGRFGQSSYTQLFGVANEARGNPVFSPDNKNDFFNNLGPF